MTEKTDEVLLFARLGSEERVETDTVLVKVPTEEGVRTGPPLSSSSR